MFTMILLKDTYGSRPAMYHYTTLEGAVKMAEMGYREDVAIFSPDNILVAHFVGGERVV